MTQTPTTPRPDEDRDKLAEAMYDWCPFRTSDGEPIPWAKTTAGDRSNLLSCADAIIAAGFTRTPAPRSTKDAYAGYKALSEAASHVKKRIQDATDIGISHTLIMRAMDEGLSQHPAATDVYRVSQQQQQPPGGDGPAGYVAKVVDGEVTWVPHPTAWDATPAPTKGETRAVLRLSCDACGGPVPDAGGCTCVAPAILRADLLRLIARAALARPDEAPKSKVHD